MNNIIFSCREYFARDGTCTIVNNWNETIMTDGQKVVRYTVVLKFDDQMVANSVKQKLVNVQIAFVLGEIGCVLTVLPRGPTLPL